MPFLVPQRVTLLVIFSITAVVKERAHLTHLDILVTTRLTQNAHTSSTLPRTKSSRSTLKTLILRNLKSKCIKNRLLICVCLYDCIMYVMFLSKYDCIMYVYSYHIFGFLAINSMIAEQVQFTE